MEKYVQQAINSTSEDGYLLYHAPRYCKLLSIIRQYYTGVERILDIGRSPFTEIAHKTFGVKIDTLGFEADKYTNTGVNYQFDLNDSQEYEKYRRDIPQYDIIIFSEVIEHLYTSPKLVLRFLSTLVNENGIIIIQTPNAVVLHKRIQFLIGKNPFSLISENVNNPAHFREYTMAELIGYCKDSNFSVIYKSHENYFDYRYTRHASESLSFNRKNIVINFIYSMVPYSFRPGLCLVIRPKI